MRAKYQTTCICGLGINPGAEIRLVDGEWMHKSCALASIRPKAISRQMQLFSPLERARQRAKAKK